MAVTLYETSSGLLILARWDEVAWSLQIADRTNLMGRFAEHAEAWTSGDWEPNETDGWHPASVDDLDNLDNLDDLTVIATWDAVHGVTLQVHRHELGDAAQDYLPSLIVKSFTYTRENANPAWGIDVITITASGTEVIEEHTVDGVTRSDSHRRSFVDEFEVELHLRRRDVDYAGEGYEGVVSR
ncbi:hypothetical protein [Nonomuraea sp. NPDC049625]|uniref:hypothetical protein n=1 Tax=Nonomuraea sp. NPDC049625 TaxID=3155775 RepID=UPI00343E855A